MSASTTACPLDCYDACSIVYSDEKLSARKAGHTQGFLCPHLNHYEQFERIQTPRYIGKEISMDEALLKLKEILKESPKEEILHYRGSGNFGLMQESTDHFFAKFGATLTDGSLCDGAGEAGIIEGRGSNKNMPLSEIAKSEVVILWGRNPHTSSSHLLPFLKGKKIIVIDPVKIKSADSADLFLQIKPHMDSYLALLIVRFLYINEYYDEEYTSELEEYYELTQTIRIKSMLENMGITLGDIGKLIEMIEGKKVAIVVGIGVQKYKDGADILRSIDAIAAALGLFGKEGSGVAYLGNSKEGIESPFETQAKRISKVDTAFDKYKAVFIQGSNPLSQMPDTFRVQSALQKTQNLVYFGLHENETSAAATLVIPAKTFLEKEDIRVSYSHNALLPMPKLKDSTIGISEYELSAYLCGVFDMEIKSETEYIEHFLSFGKEQADGSYLVKDRETTPYSEGFDTDDGEFLFLEEIEIDRKINKVKLRKNKKAPKVSNMLHLITPKSEKSLNSQFTREKYVYIHSSLGYKEGQEIEIESENGTVCLAVKLDDRLRSDSLLIYSGTPGVNNLTSSEHSYEGKTAVYQDSLVSIVQ